MLTNDALVDLLQSKGVLYDDDVERAMRRVDRLEFTDPHYAGQAYQDRQLPGGLKQALPEPHMVALMTQYLSVTPGIKILEIGSCYQAAILSELVGFEGEVHLLEQLPEHAKSSKKMLSRFSNITVHIGSAVAGLKKLAPFDRILVAGAVYRLPSSLMDQLAEDGKMIISLGRGAAQRLTLAEKFAGQIRKTDLNLTCVLEPISF